MTPFKVAKHTNLIKEKGCFLCIAIAPARPSFFTKRIIYDITTLVYHKETLDNIVVLITLTQLIFFLSLCFCIRSFPDINKFIENTKPIIIPLTIFMYFFIINFL